MRRLRLNGYDYSQNGAYFVTICAKDRAEIFSHLITVGYGQARPVPYGDASPILVSSLCSSEIS
jgi:hypothetical protein